MADETEKITYEIVVDDSKAAAPAKNVADNLKKGKESAAGFSDALNKMVPGLGAAASGMAAMVKQAIAFIATGWGAVIVAVGASVAALTAYFKGSEEGQDRWNKITVVATTIFEKYMDLVEAYGKLIYRVFTEPKKVIEEFIQLISEDLTKSFTSLKKIFHGLATGDINEFQEGVREAGEVAAKSFKRVADAVQGVVDEIKEGIEEGKRLSDLMAKIDREERELVTERATTNREVAKLRREAITQEFEEKKETIEKAIALEEALAAKETEHARTKLALAQLELKANGDDKEAKMKVAEATAAITNAETRRFEATLRFAKELEAIAEAEKLRKAKEEEDFVKKTQDVIKTLEDKAAREIEINAQVAAEMQAINDEERRRADEDFEAYKKREKDKEKIKKESAKLADELVRSGIMLAAAATGESKVIALANIAYDTGKAIAGLTANSEENPANAFTFGAAGALQFAIGLIRILTNIASATAVVNSHERGGILRGPSHSQGGIPFSVGGRLGFEAEGGEAIINKRSTAMYRSQLSAINAAGGGVRFADGGMTPSVPSPFAAFSIAQQINNDRMLSNLTNAMDRLKVAVIIEEVEAKTQQRAQIREQASL